MERDTIKEKIKYYTEIVKVFWTIMIVLTGGLSALLVNLDNIFKILLFIFGLVGELIVILFIRDFNKKIYCLLAKLEIIK